MGSLGVNVPAVIVVGISLVIGLVMVVVFRYTSDQKAIHVAKDRLKAHLLALRLFQDQIPVVLRSYGRIVLATGRYLRLAFKPLLFVIVPLTFLIVQLDRYLGSMPVEAGHPFLVNGADGQSKGIRMRHRSNCRMGWRLRPRRCTCLRKTKLPGELSPKSRENTSSMFKPLIRLFRNE